MARNSSQSDMGQLAKNSKEMWLCSHYFSLLLLLLVYYCGWSQQLLVVLYLLSHATLDGFDLNPSCNYSLPAFVYLRKNIILRRMQTLWLLCLCGITNDALSVTFASAVSVSSCCALIGWHQDATSYKGQIMLLGTRKVQKAERAGAMW